MALIDIMRQCATTDGISVSDAQEKELLRVKINNAAREIYEADDFMEALEESIFNIDVSSQLVAFPWYVEYLRGWRYHESRVAGATDDKNNRYQDGTGNELWYRRFRHVEYSAIERSIDNESNLIISIPLAESEEFSVNVIGRTSNSNKIQETVTFAVGETTKTTTNAYTKVYSIVKNTETQYDVTVKDVLDNTLTVIPNNLKECRYKITQILDCDVAYFSATTSAIEVLYKRKFQDLVNDSDEFMFGNKYDMAIYWKYKEHRAEAEGDNTDAAVGFYKKCREVLMKIDSNMYKGNRIAIGFTSNAYFTLPYLQGQKSYRYFSTRLP